MRLKTAAEQRPELEVPPPELRLFTDPSRAAGVGDGLGQGTYGTRAAWIAARRAWETAHGITLAEWFDLACDDGAARGGLEGLSTAFGCYLTEDEDDCDPRVTAGAQPAGW